ncbi:MAG: radical SAM protein, partial [Christensenellales bacterium]
DKYIDIYLVDYKYYDDELALNLSNVKNYRRVCFDAIKFMCQSKKDVFVNGIMKQGVIIRHLILPNHIYNTFQVLNDIKQNFPNRLVSLMAQYVPCSKALEIKGLNRKISKREYEKAVDKFLSLNLQGFIQERESADKNFIPKFTQ